MNLWKLLKFTLTSLCLAIFLTGNSNSGVKLKYSEILSPTETKKPIKKHQKELSSAKKKINVRSALQLRPELISNKWQTLHGNLNGNYVSLHIKTTRNRMITGYLFDDEGNSQYIYGERFKNHLQVYDQSNRLLTVILSN